VSVKRGGLDSNAANAGAANAGSAAAGARRGRLWLFNLDAEIELARRSRPYQTPLRVARALGAMLERAQVLMAPGDESLDPLAPMGRTKPITAPKDEGRRSGERRLGCAWCPTPSALARLARAGADLPESPSVEVLGRVNHRRFAIELGGGAPGARFVSDDGALVETLAEPRGAWLFKRAYGFAGRGQRRIIGVPTKDDRRWLSDSLRLGGFVAEPWLELEREVGLHGLIDASGSFVLGRICVQETNEFRAWVSTRPALAEDLSSAQAAQLTERAEKVAAALIAAGYFGPFGIDAYLFRTRSGGLQLNPLSELNARYSMGFAVGWLQPSRAEI
jgi:hypothetical protein